MGIHSSVVVMGERDVAQAVVLIQALSDVRDEMIARMTWLERRGARLDAAALRRDVNEAQAHITRLQRRYLGGDVQASQPVRQARQARLNQLAAGTRLASLARRLKPASRALAGESVRVAGLSQPSESQSLQPTDEEILETRSNARMEP